MLLVSRALLTDRSNRFRRGLRGFPECISRGQRRSDQLLDNPGGRRIGHGDASKACLGLMVRRVE